MNSTSFFSTLENGFRNLFNLPPVADDPSLSPAELKNLLQVDVIFNQLHQKIEEGADLESPKLTVFEFKTHTITLLNYTNKDIGFNKYSCLYFKDNSGWTRLMLEFAKDDCKVIAYGLENNSELVLFEQQDVYRTDTNNKRLLAKLNLNGGTYEVFSPLDLSHIIKSIFAKKKEHQKDAITFLINASKFDPNSAFNIIPKDIIAVILGRYEDALKKEFPSQYRG